MLSFDASDDRYLSELAEWVALPSVSRDAGPETMRAFLSILAAPGAAATWDR